MATPKKPWPRGAEWARQDAIVLISNAIDALRRDDTFVAMDCIREAREKLMIAGSVSAVEDQTLREYIESVVEKYLTKTEENDNARRGRQTEDHR